MAEVVTSEGLVIAVTNASGGVFPFACAKNATLSISRDTLELAPRTNGVFREYIQNRMSFTVSGNGLVKMAESNMQPITFFDTFIEGTDQEFLCYLDMIDKTGNYKVYQFTAFITSLSISSNVNEFGSYDYTLQGTGPLVEISTVDSYTVASGYITGRNTATFKLVAVGIEGKWYYNYTVTSPSAGVFEINIGTSFNGKTVKAAYISI
jgi:hypothetical protein